VRRVGPRRGGTGSTPRDLAGTRLSGGLAIVRDELNRAYGATHYTIAPAFNMPLEHFRALLDQLAQEMMKEAG
jgi:hypothetical protein